MNRWSRKFRRIGLAIGCVAIISALGVTCPPPFGPRFVDIELVNFTDFDVDPRIFIHPVSGVPFEELFRPENELIVDPLLLPGEEAIFTFRCQDVGTIGSDFALMFITPILAIESDNGPVVDEGIDFFCGDIVSFVFIDDGIEFYTSVEVNGVIIID